MGTYLVILKSLTREGEKIILDEFSSFEAAKAAQKTWRQTLGGKRWTIDRRPGLDTIGHLALTVEKI